MSLKFKITSVVPNPNVNRQHTQLVTVEILNPAGVSLPSAKSLTVETTKGASIEDVKMMVREELPKEMGVSELTGEIFSL